MKYFTSLRKLKTWPQNQRTFQPSIHFIISLGLLFVMMAATTGLRAQWIQQGPGPTKNSQVDNITNRPTVGAINCVAPHPTDANILYIGAVNGGVWRTANALASTPVWTFISGDLSSQSIGALEFDPTDATHQTLVLGNGRFSSFYGVGSGNRGIFRTTNGTGPWTNIDAGGTFATRNVTGIAARGATILVATNVGIWRTANTGGVWTQISGGAGTGLPAGSSFDLVGDPSNNAVFYTNAGSNGIYKTVNTGANWTKVSDAALDADLANSGNLEMAVGNSDNVFVAIVRAGRLGDIYRSGNGGTNWTALDIPQITDNGVVYGIHPGGQGNTHLSLAADPSNSNVVYIGGDRQNAVNDLTPTASFPNGVGASNYTGRLFRVDASLAAGSQATPITHIGTAGSSAPHADSRDMDFDAGGDLIESDDGGVYKQTSPADATGNWFSLIGNINVTEIHSIDWDANSNIIISGAQDNAIPQQEFPTNSIWANAGSGDGGDVVVDDVSSTATSTRYSSAQNLQGFVRRVYSPGNVLQSAASPALINVATGTRISGFFFVNPIKINRQNGSRMIVCTSGALFESSDQGNTVNNIGAISVNNDGRDAIAYGAADNADILYVGAGATVRIRTAAPPAALTTSAAYTGGTVEGIVVDPDDSHSAYVIDATHVFETTTTGGAWTNITGNLLALNPGSFRSIAYIPTTTDDILAVGTDLGVYIAPGPAFNVWSRLGTNLPSVAVYDLEYDVNDKILLAGTMGRGAWTFNMSERNPVDVALVLDFSGSMLSNACPTCAPKLNVLKDAAEIFMQLWKGLAVTNDRIGSVYFRTNINRYEEGGIMLLPVITKTDAIISSIRAETTTPFDLTAMGGGLQSAINSLTDATRPRNIILFTDGMQNVNPGVTFPALNIQNGVFGTNSNITATSPATVLNAALGIKINTIGVGATSAFESQLADIATGTNGLTKITTAPDEDLRRFFVEELVDVLRAFSPQLVDYRKGTLVDSTTKTENFSINQSAKKVIFKISYQRGDEVRINIFKGSTDVTQWATRTSGGFYQIFSFPFEKLALFQGANYDGPWQVRMRSGKRSAMSYEIAAIADEANLKYNLSLGTGLHKTGQPLHLDAQVLVGGDVIVEDVSVTATIQRPDQGLGTLLSKKAMPGNNGAIIEPNLPIGAQKLTRLSQDQLFVNSLKPVASAITFNAGADRFFRADFNNTSVPGTYTVNFLIKGTHPYTGPFERMEQRTVVLRFSAFDLKASNVKISRVRQAGRTVWTWEFTPKDKFGNYLGPDYGQVMNIKTSDGTIRNVKDLGNGTYQIEILTANTNRPHLELGLYDETWFNGVLPYSQKPQWSASIHAGASIPVGNFANDYKTGIYGKIDLEYLFQNNWGIQLVGGIYGFKKDLHVSFGVLQLKRYFPVSTNVKLFAEAGPGLYSFSTGNSYGGFDLGTGLDFQLNSRCTLSVNGNYSVLPNHPKDYKWVGAGLGFHYRF